MSILIIGDGWIGKMIHDSIKGSIISTTRIKRSEDVVNEINRVNADWVINCVGRTGMPNIDWCERNREETIFVNLIVPLLIQRACSFTNTKMVHISTGCLYEGSMAFKEEDTPNFVYSYYSKTKYMAQQALEDYKVLQLRIRMPIDSNPHPRNFLTKILNYEKLINCENSITVVSDFIFALKELMNQRAYGIFNIVNPMPISHEDIIDIYNNSASEKKKYKNISLEELHQMTLTKRSNCTLSTEKLSKHGIKLRTSREALIECVKEYTNIERLYKLNPKEICQKQLIS